jgi:predicted XRE-type DNA-binding protein
MATKRNSPIKIHPSSGNVFADLGLSNPDERQTKVMLAVALNTILEPLKLSQTELAQRLGINQPKVSALINYKLQGFSVERLLGFVTALDHDVQIVIKKRPRSTRSGTISVHAA